MIFGNDAVDIFERIRFQMKHLKITDVFNRTGFAPSDVVVHPRSCGKQSIDIDACLSIDVVNGLEGTVHEVWH